MADQTAEVNLDSLKSKLEEAWREIPKPYRNEHSVRRVLQCRLYGILWSMGYQTVADYMPPRIADRPIDLIAMNADLEIIYAFCIDTVVTLAAVKSLSSFEAKNKIVFTTGLLEKKVMESRFFLKPEIRHVHVQPFEKHF